MSSSFYSFPTRSSLHFYVFCFAFVWTSHWSMSNSTVAAITEDSLFLQQPSAAVSSPGWGRSYDPLPIDGWIFTGTVFCRPCAGYHSWCEFLSLETMWNDSVSQPPPWWLAPTSQHLTASSLMVGCYIIASHRPSLMVGSYITASLSLLPDGWLLHYCISLPLPWWLALTSPHLLANFKVR